MLTFRLTSQQAENIVYQVKTAVKNWRKYANAYKISKREQEIKSSAFRRAFE